MLNVNKYKVMQMGRSNLNCDYYLGNHKLHSVVEEKDLWVLVTSNLNHGSQCGAVVKKTTKIVCMIKRNFVLRGADVVIKSYMSLVRHQLDYCSQV